MLPLSKSSIAMFFLTLEQICGSTPVTSLILHMDVKMGVGGVEIPVAGAQSAWVCGSELMSRQFRPPVSCSPKDATALE